jgi:hypothetical protein
VEEYDTRMEKEHKEKKHPPINQSAVSFEDINPNWSSSSARTPSMSPSAKSPSMSPPKSPSMSPPKSPSMSPPKSPSMSPPKSPSMSPPKSPSMSPPKPKPIFVSEWIKTYKFLGNDHRDLFKSFPKKKQELILQMSNGDPVLINRMLMNDGFNLKYRIGNHLKHFYSLPEETQYHIIKLTNKDTNKIMEIMENDKAVKQMLKQTGHNV